MAKALFDAAFPLILDDSLPTSTSDDLALARDWIKKILEANVPHGKKNRGLSVITSYQHLVQKRSLTEKEIKQLYVLGWCTEILHSCCLVADDIMDHSETRRGQPCWFRRDEVGLIAVNDAFIMEGVVYKLLKKYFRAEPYYVDLLESFLETTHSTEIGQTLDLLTASEGKCNFDQFTLARYKTIVKYKTSLYSFYEPVAIAMQVAGITESSDYEIAKNILIMMGEFFQIQDDYLDCFGDPTMTGKVGTDIGDNKCTWLVVQALNRVTPEQRAVLEENYGRKDPLCVSCIKQLYVQLGIPEEYKMYEESSFKSLMEYIDRESGRLPKAMFIEFANRIYKREK